MHGLGKKHAAHENHERWLVSYADFITLLFAFFVVMFASSQADKNKAKAVSESVREAFDGKAPKAPTILGGVRDDTGKGNAAMRGPGGAKPDTKAPPVKLSVEFEQLTAQLQDALKKGNIEITLDPRGLVISLKQAAFFPSGQENIATEGDATLHKIASALKKIPSPVRLEGHTDSVPIRNGRFHNNWELSAARAVSVLDFLNADGLDNNRMAIVGYADTAPIDTTGMPAGLARNRRVDIVILNDLTGYAGPASAKKR